MFELQSTTFFGNEAKKKFGHAVIFMNRDNHASKFEVIFNRDNNGEWHFYYEDHVLLTRDERADFESWFIRLFPKEKKTTALYDGFQTLVI